MCICRIQTFEKLWVKVCFFVLIQYDKRGIKSEIQNRIMVRLQYIMTVQNYNMSTDNDNDYKI
jgi:hypothetical protein